MDIKALSAMLRARRGTRGLRDVAQEIKVSASTLSRIEQGKLPDLDTFMRLCNWLNVPPQQFMSATEQTEAFTISSTPEIITAHLRADRTLEPETAEALATMIRLAYQMAKQNDQGK